jgi:hypothetical protein
MAGDTIHRHILIPAFLADQRTSKAYGLTVFFILNKEFRIVRSGR